MGLLVRSTQKETECGWDSGSISTSSETLGNGSTCRSLGKGSLRHGNRSRRTLAKDSLRHGSRSEKDYVTVRGVEGERSVCDTPRRTEVTARPTPWEEGSTPRPRPLSRQVLLEEVDRAPERKCDRETTEKYRR